MDLYSWIMESIKAHFLWRNSSVTHQTANETELLNTLVNMKQDLKGNTSFKILFASMLLSAGMYLPTSHKNITEDAPFKGTKQWYQTIPRTVVSSLHSFTVIRIVYFLYPLTVLKTFYVYDFKL